MKKIASTYMLLSMCACVGEPFSTAGSTPDAQSAGIDSGTVATVDARGAGESSSQQEASTLVDSSAESATDAAAALCCALPSGTLRCSESSVNCDPSSFPVGSPCDKQSPDGGVEWGESEWCP